MTNHILSVKASGEVRDANGNIKSEEIIDLSGQFTEEEISQIMHQLNLAKEIS